MNFALNYSRAAERFLEAGRIQIDLFKLPAWPDLVDQVCSRHPGYIHFPLLVTGGDGIVLDAEKDLPADFDLIERLLTKTGTSKVNIHLCPAPERNTDIPQADRSPGMVQEVTGRMIRDVENLVRRFGASKVIAENDAGGPEMLAAGLEPEVVHSVIEATGCGFLFDLSHARLAARQLGMDPREYIACLPTDRIREMHITGIQKIDEGWMERLRSGGMDEAFIQRHAGRWNDHLPLTAEDWEFAGWAMEQVHRGYWNTPEIVAIEYGGIGGFFEAVSEEAVILEQIPQLKELVKGKQN